MPTPPPAPSVGLIVLSSTGRLPNGRTAGFWLPEAAYPWRGLTAAGWDFAFTSTRPGRPPLGGADPSDPAQRAFLADGRVREELDATVTPDGLDPAAYGVVFVAGGHGAVIDLGYDPGLARFLSIYAANGRCLAAVCHGVGALLGVHAADGAPLVAGRRVTGFTREEDLSAGLEGQTPCFLDEALTALGARFESGPAFQGHVVVDDMLVTGQNPASIAALVEQAMMLATGRPLPKHWMIRPAVSV